MTNTTNLFETPPNFQEIKAAQEFGQKLFQTRAAISISTILQALPNELRIQNWQIYIAGLPFKVSFLCFLTLFSLPVAHFHHTRKCSEIKFYFKKDRGCSLQYWEVDADGHKHCSPCWWAGGIWQLQKFAVTFKQQHLQVLKFMHNNFFFFLFQALLPTMRYSIAFTFI